MTTCSIYIYFKQWHLQKLIPLFYVQSFNIEIYVALLNQVASLKSDMRRDSDKLRSLLSY